MIVSRVTAQPLKHIAGKSTPFAPPIMIAQLALSDAHYADCSRLSYSNYLAIECATSIRLERERSAMRNIRRDGNDHFKKLEKEKHISEDDVKRLMEEVQKVTDEFTKKVDTAVADKTKEIMQV